MESSAKDNRLVIIGLDTADSGFIEQWAREGYLPTIASVMEKGCWGRTAGNELISEHGVWVSLFSGVSRVRHGYYYFRQLAAGSYDLQSTTGSDADCAPFWSFLRDTGKKAAIIDAPDAAPVPGLRGVQLANWSVHDTWNPKFYRTKSEPPELLPQIVRKFGPKLKAVEQIESSFSEDRKYRRQLLEYVEKKGQLARHLLSRDSFDLSLVVFSECHAANHQFWKYCPQVHQRYGLEPPQHELTDAIRDIYQAIDREIGLLLAEAPGDVDVFIVSSVGMEDDYPTAGLTEAFCRQLGYQVSPARSGSGWRPVDLARRLIPESWRVALSRHLPWAQRERLLADAFRNGTDWSKTTAFAIPSLYTGFVRVNLRGREPEGIVNSEAEYAAVLDRIEADLGLLVDPETGQPAVSRVLRTTEIFRCDPHPTLPDLFVEWKPGSYMGCVDHPEAKIQINRPEFSRRSDHNDNGFVAGAGPSIQRRGEVGSVEVLDLAPTFLSILGEPVPVSMSGSILADWTRADTPLPSDL